MPRPPKISKSSTIPKASASAPFSVLYWQTPCVCGFQAKSAAEWQHHGIVYQGCGKGSAPFQHHRKQRKPNEIAQTRAQKESQ
jgi:hypothetical protein